MDASMHNKKKKVVVLVDGGPFNTVRPSEAFRMAIGLTLGSNDVSIILLDDGVFHLKKLRGDQIGRPSLYDVIGVFEKIGLKLYADQEAVGRRNIDTPPKESRSLPYQEIMGLIRGADVVIPFR